MTKEIIEIVEQHAIYENPKREMMPGSLLIEVLNHHAYGGTKETLKEGIDSGELGATAKLYRTRVIIEVEEIDPNGPHEGRVAGLPAERPFDAVVGRR